MKRAATITFVLLLAQSISCGPAGTERGDPVAETRPGKAPSAQTAPASDEPIDLLDQCRALLDKARKTSSTDPKAALEILDEAFERLHDCTYTANQVYWLQMKSDLDRARAEFTEPLKASSR